MFALLEKFRASRPFALAVGRCARIDGDNRPFLITEWGGATFEVACLAGDTREIITRPVAEVRVINAKGKVCAACRYDRTGCRNSRR